MKRLTLLALAAALAMTIAAAAQTPGGPKRLKPVFKNQRQARMLPMHRQASEAPAPSIFDGLQVYVNLTNSDDWEQLGLSDTPYGIYTYTLGSGQDFQPLATSYLYGFMASAMGRSEFIGVRPMEVFGALQGVEYDGLSGNDFSKKWEQVYMDADYSYVSSAMAYDPTSGQIYSLQYNEDLTGMNLCVWNEEFRVFNPIEAWPNRFQPVAMAFDPAGQLYCLGGDGNYYKIDKRTGEATLVAPMNVEPTLYVQSMAYDNRSGYFVWMATEQTGSAFYAVEPQSGQATLISRLPKNEQAASIFFRHGDAKAKAPAAVSDLRFNYSAEGSTTGNIVFTVPTKTFDGSNLNSDVTMSVWLDGHTLATDVSVQAGATQTFAFDVTAENHYVYVVLKNSDGFSPASSSYAYAGYDYPLPVADVNLSIADGTAQLTWTAPSGGVNGGFIDRDALTYDVVRMPGSVLVAKDTKKHRFHRSFA